MAVTEAQMIQMLRNVTGRVDASDPQFTNTVMSQKLNAFYTQMAPQDVRLFRDRTWWEFTIDENTAMPYQVDLDALGFSTIGPLAYADGFEIFWCQDPGEFFLMFPETQEYTPSRPQYLLYYNNEIVFRPTPNEEYDIKISAYKVNDELTANNDLPVTYLCYYVVFGAAINIHNEWGELDQAAALQPAFMKYRSYVYARTYDQYQNQRTSPEF